MTASLRFANLNCSISGPEAEEMPLFVKAPTAVSGQMDLVIMPPAHGIAPLFIGKDILTGGTGVVPLFVQSAFATGVIVASGGASEQEFLNLAVLSQSGVTAFNNADLYLEGPPVGSGVGVFPLTLVTDPAPTPNANGSISDSGVATLVVNASNESGVFTEFARDMPLSMVSHSKQNKAMDLYIDFPFGAIIPLSIRSPSTTGALDLSVNAAGQPSGTMHVSVMAPFNKVMTLSSEGVDASGEAPTFE